MYNKVRGRPRGKSGIYYTHLKSIVKLANKHDLDPQRLVDAFVEAWENKIAHCGCLQIARRDVNQDSVIFLITKDEKVVWQFAVNLESIGNPAFLKQHIQDVPLPLSTEQKGYQKNQQIGNLRFGMKGIDITARITKIPQSKHVFTRWGSEAYVSNASIADETGSIKLSLWNNQIRQVHVGDQVAIKNCIVSRFANELQLRLGRKGTISINNQSQQDDVIPQSVIQ
jgi:replication factor A1